MLFVYLPLIVLDGFARMFIESSRAATASAPATASDTRASSRSEI